jgi:hypothetical protein
MAEMAEYLNDLHATSDTEGEDGTASDRPQVQFDPGANTTRRFQKGHESTESEGELSVDGNRVIARILRSPRGGRKPEKWYGLLSPRFKWYVTCNQTERNYRVGVEKFRQIETFPNEESGREWASEPHYKPIDDDENGPDSRRKSQPKAHASKKTEKTRRQTKKAQEAADDEDVSSPSEEERSGHKVRTTSKKAGHKTKKYKGTADSYDDSMSDEMPELKLRKSKSNKRRVKRLSAKERERKDLKRRSKDYDSSESEDSDSDSSAAAASSSPSSSSSDSSDSSGSYSRSSSRRTGARSTKKKGTSKSKSKRSKRNRKRRARRSRKQNKDQTPYYRDDPSTGNKDRVFTQHVAESALDEILCPADLSRHDQQDFSKLMMDVTQLPGMYFSGPDKTTSKAQGAIEGAAAMMAQVGAQVAGRRGRSGVDPQWMLEWKAALCRVKTPEQLYQMIKDVRSSRTPH